MNPAIPVTTHRRPEGFGRGWNTSSVLGSVISLLSGRRAGHGQMAYGWHLPMILNCGDEQAMSAR